MTDTTRLSAALADRYRIERELGQGGMATVYLANDLRHDRKVAIKVLKPELAAVLGGERFVVEIKTTAALQHPHILPLFDSGAVDSFLYYVMPFVEGETLRAKLDREHQLGIDEAIRITTEVADALDYAHRHGVIHRDIKPENILLHDGRPMVADFGIALALSAAAGGRMTETGLSLGTPHYMSPEQATAEKELTPRSDIYSLASVLYEMLTGNPPHVGASAQQIIMKIVTEDVAPVNAQRKSVPPNVADAVAKALEKLPADRFATAAEFAQALTSPAFTRPMTGVDARAAGPAAHRWRHLALAAGAFAAVAALIAAWGWFRPGLPRPVTRYGLGFPEGQAPTGQLALSPDASRMVYVGPGEGEGEQLWVKERAEYAATPLPGTANSASPIVSPDGEWIAFVQAGAVKKMPITGGAAITLADTAFGAPMAWMEDGSLIFSRLPDMARVSGSGGEVTILWADSTVGAQSRAALFPSVLPGDRGILFSTCTNLCLTSDLWVLDLAANQARQLLPGVRQGWYLPTGHLVYVRADGSMFAVPFDARAMEPRGTPVPVLEAVGMAFNDVVPNLAISTNGTLVMQAGGVLDQAATYEAVWVDRAGRVTPVDTTWRFHLTVSNGNAGLSLSPDGRRLAIGLNTDSGDDIWIKVLPDGPLSRLTFDSTAEERPRWTSDGRSVTYVVEDLNALRQRPADGTGREETLVTTATLLLEGSWAPGGTQLLLRTGGNAGSVRVRNILTYRPGTDSVPIELLASAQADEFAPTLSPDGHWLAYVSDETGRDEVYIRPFPNVDDGKWQVSAGGAQAPLWAHSGRELFYVDAERNMMMVKVPPAGPSQLGARVKLFTLDGEIYLTDREFYTPFDISPDDRRFLMLRRVDMVKAEAPTFLLVENWFEELKAKLGN